MKKTKKIFTKTILFCIRFSFTLFTLFIIFFIYYLYFWTPNIKKTRELIYLTLGYSLPTSSKLIYSKNYWESLDLKEPRSMCFVFKYSQKAWMKFQNRNFPNKDDKQISLPIPIDKGCAKFRSRLQPIDLALLNKRYENIQRLKGGTIFVNENNRVVMFEIYLFD